MPIHLRLLALSALLILPLAQNPSAGLSAQEGYEDMGRPMLGVVMTPPSSRDVRNNQIDPGVGVVVRRVYEGSAAEHMGLQRGDVVTEINGVPINSMSDLRQVIQGYLPGDEVHVAGIRQSQPIQRDGFLGDWPDSIPFRDIDAQAEARYRRMVEQRNQRQASALDNLREEEAALARELDQLRSGSDPSLRPGPNQSQAPAQSPSALRQNLAAAALGGQFASLLGMPSWRFHYGFGVGDTQPNMLHHQAPMQVNDDSGIHFSFQVSSELL
ncbi:MAG: PDZ domain-containing protein [Planctomycetota bacterium]|nr:MAG: PDZ domain-containing protein [Planctomycetota bacterium]